MYAFWLRVLNNTDYTTSTRGRHQTQSICFTSGSTPMMMVVLSRVQNTSSASMVLERRWRLRSPWKATSTVSLHSSQRKIFIDSCTKIWLVIFNGRFLHTTVYMKFLLSGMDQQHRRRSILQAARKRWTMLWLRSISMNLKLFPRMSVKCLSSSWPGTRQVLLVLNTFHYEITVPTGTMGPNSFWGSRCSVGCCLWPTFHRCGRAWVSWASSICSSTFKRKP